MIKLMDKDASWKTILDYSEKMMQLASEENWNEVANIAVERHQTVNEHFQRYPVGPETADYYYLKLNDFLTNEKELQAIATNARKQVMKHGVNFQQGQKASLAYTNSAKNF
jgi:hypothetical protein